MARRRWLALALIAALLLTGCGRVAPAATRNDVSGRPIRAVATTGMVVDVVRNVGGERVTVVGLMGPGVDPHLYKASEGDVIRLAEADIVFYNGLHLEAKMAEVFERMQGRIRTVAVTDGIDRGQLLAPPAFAGNYDPHVWFDVSLWMQTVAPVRDALIDLDPGSAALYRANADRYLAELAELHAYVTAQASRIPPAQRVLITAHDAFNYFGRAYGFEVRGLQGISTATEAGTADVQALADFIVARRIPAMFVESSVSPRAIEAVREAVRARGFDVTVGGQLFSDAMGSPGTPAGTYIGMVRHNIDTIVAALEGAE
ncbi:MAG: zinc ABC transporter substrate-binding protein [Sphaerobacter sp.]|nr:zinc ABC transporter substrate-binding protein [Sphaerobacter sp.]